MVACGSSGANETVAYKLWKLLEERMLKAKVRVASPRHLIFVAKQGNVLVYIAPNDSADYGVLSFNGVPFLAGFGVLPIMSCTRSLSY